MPLKCPYCGKKAKLVDFGAPGYPYLENHGWLHICFLCKAWVGCHARGNGKTALGHLANAELRRARQAAHRAFESLVHRKVRKDGCTAKTARDCGYGWMASELGLSLDRMHIAQLNLDECLLVVELCSRFSRTTPDQHELFSLERITA